MANAKYTAAADKILQYALLGTGGFNAYDLRAVLVTSTYTFSAAHEFYSSLTGTISSAVALTTESVSGGAFDCDNITFSAVAGGTTYNAVVIYQHTGVDATADLVAYFDTTSDASLPVVSNGGDITVNINVSGVLSIPTTEVYTSAANAILQKGLLNTGGFGSNDIYALLTTSTYTYSAAHDFRDDVTGTVTTGVQMANEAVTSGVYDADDPTYSSVASGTFDAILWYMNVGTAGTDDLICYQALDSSLTANGGDLTINLDASGIMQI